MTLAERRRALIAGGAAQAGPAYTNQIPISQDANGNVYNVTGYKNDVRLNSSGAEVEMAYAIVTGYIPVKAGDVIRFSGVYVDGTSGGQNSWFYANDKTNRLYFLTPYMFYQGQTYANNYVPYDYDANSQTLYSITVPNDSRIAYVRFTLHGSSGADAIITVNEIIPN